MLLLSPLWPFFFSMLKLVSCDEILYHYILMYPFNLFLSSFACRLQMFASLPVESRQMMQESSAAGAEIQTQNQPQQSQAHSPRGAKLRACRNVCITVATLQCINVCNGLECKSLQIFIWAQVTCFWSLYRLHPGWIEWMPADLTYILDSTIIYMKTFCN